MNRNDPADLDLERELVRIMAERRITRRQLLERMTKVGAAAALAPIVAACATPPRRPARSLASSERGSHRSARGDGERDRQRDGRAHAAADPGEPALHLQLGRATSARTTIAGLRGRSTGSRSSTTSSRMPRPRSPRSGATARAAATTSPTRRRRRSRALVRDGVIQPLDLALIPNIANLGTDWQNPAYDPGNKHSVPNYWWTTGFAWDPDKVKGDLTSWAALWDEQYKGHIGMLDDYQEVFAAGAFRLGFDANTTDEAQLDAVAGPARAAEAAAAQVHARTTSGT